MEISDSRWKKGNTLDESTVVYQSPKSCDTTSLYARGQDRQEGCDKANGTWNQWLIQSGRRGWSCPHESLEWYSSRQNAN